MGVESKSSSRWSSRPSSIPIVDDESVYAENVQACCDPQPRLTATDHDNGRLTILISHCPLTDIQPIVGAETAGPFLATRATDANLLLVTFDCVECRQKHPAHELLLAAFWCWNEPEYAATSAGFSLKCEIGLDALGSRSRNGAWRRASAGNGKVTWLVSVSRWVNASLIASRLLNVRICQVNTTRSR